MTELEISQAAEIERLKFERDSAIRMNQLRRTLDKILIDAETPRKPPPLRDLWRGLKLIWNDRRKV